MVCAARARCASTRSRGRTLRVSCPNARFCSSRASCEYRPSPSFSVYNSRSPRHTASALASPYFNVPATLMPHSVQSRPSVTAPPLLPFRSMLRISLYASCASSGLNLSGLWRNSIRACLTKSVAFLVFTRAVFASAVPVSPRWIASCQAPIAFAASFSAFFVSSVSCGFRIIPRSFSFLGGGGRPIASVSPLTSAPASSCKIVSFHLLPRAAAAWSRPRKGRRTRFSVTTVSRSSASSSALRHRALGSAICTGISHRRALADGPSIGIATWSGTWSDAYHVAVSRRIPVPFSVRAAAPSARRRPTSFARMWSVSDISWMPALSRRRVWNFWTESPHPRAVPEMTMTLDSPPRIAAKRVAAGRICASRLADKVLSALAQLDPFCLAPSKPTTLSSPPASQATPSSAARSRASAIAAAHASMCFFGGR